MPPTIDRMNCLVRAWEEARDRRAVFLGCYALMTGNMLRAVEAGRFRDPEWTGRLLERFAAYYFTALEQVLAARRDSCPPVDLGRGLFSTEVFS